MCAFKSKAYHRSLNPTDRISRQHHGPTCMSEGPNTFLICCCSNNQICYSPRDQIEDAADERGNIFQALDNVPRSSESLNHMFCTSMLDSFSDSSDGLENVWVDR